MKNRAPGNHFVVRHIVPAVTIAICALVIAVIQLIAIGNGATGFEAPAVLLFAALIIGTAIGMLVPSSRR